MSLVTAIDTFNAGSHEEIIREQPSRWGIVLLNQVRMMFEAGRPAGECMSLLVGGLRLLKSLSPENSWKHFLAGVGAHPVMTFVHQDPFTRWSYNRPRGYPGDAFLIDYIYGAETVASSLKSATPLGQDIYSFCSSTNAPVAVRERCSIIADFIDETAAHSPHPEIFAIAGGHLREAEISTAACSGTIARWTYLDQDRESAAFVSENHKLNCLEVIEGSVRGLLSGKYTLGSYNLIYAGGLYDYLAQKTAVRLTEHCFNMLKPGGRFLFANFAKDIFDEGYMEVFMNWSLLLRDEPDMIEIAAGIPSEQVRSINTFRSTNGEILYSVVEKV